MEKVKAVISDENIEILRAGCLEKRDRAMEDLLLSTGIRVGELVNLNIADINFTTRECIVYGKGEKNAGRILMPRARFISRSTCRRGKMRIRRFLCR